MARQVFPILGAAVGTFFGAPQLGWAIGSIIGNAVDPQVIRGPSIGDLAVQASQEGGPRPFVYALSQPIAGNVIASSQPRIVTRTKRQGFLGPKVKTEHVFRTYAIGICEGPITAIVKVWRNGKIVFDRSLPTYDPDPGLSGKGAFASAVKAAALLGGAYVAFSQKSRFFLGTYDQLPSPDLEGIFGVGLTPAHRGTAYLVMADEELTELRGAIPQYQFQVLRAYPAAESAETWPVSAVVGDLALRAGLPSDLIEASQLDDEVKGFTVTNSYPASEALRALAQIFFFDPANYDGKLQFVRRGGESVATITEAEMVDDDEEIEETRRGDPIAIPRVLHLNYFDVDGDTATSKQSSERTGDHRSVGEVSIQSAVVMEADEAARAVAVNHGVMVEDQKGELHFSLPDKYIALVPSDPITVEWQGRSERVRIVRLDVHDGYQSYVLLRDRRSAYTPSIAGIPPAAPTPPYIPQFGLTLLEVLDIALLRDADDALGLGFYVAVAGDGDWIGATVQLSIDGGESVLDEGLWDVPAVIGETLTALGDHPPSYPDEVNNVSVRIATPFAELLETNLEGLLNRENLALIGDELVQFANAEETSSGEWQLSNFLRGRRGTEATAHPPGSRFVLIDAGSFVFVPTDLALRGRTLTVRAISPNDPLSMIAEESFVLAGRVQVERAPAYLQARLDGSTLYVTWQGVGRLGAGARAAHGIAWLGYVVRVTDGATTQRVDTREQALELDVSGFASPLTVSVTQVNRFTGEGAPAQVAVP